MIRALLRNAVALAVLMVVSAGSARADVILTFQEVTPGEEVSILAGATSFDPLRIGAFVYAVGDGGPQGGFPPNLSAFSAQIFASAGLNVPTSYQIVPLPQLADLQSPASGFVDPINKEAYLTELFGRYYDQTSTDVGAAAFQYAVWEILYDPLADLAVNRGYLQLTGETLNTPVAIMAQEWLDSLTGDPTYFTENPNYDGLEITGLENEEFQDLITLRQPQTPAVPAPPAALLALLGLGTLAGRMWWTRRRV